MGLRGGSGDCSLPILLAQPVLHWDSLYNEMEMPVLPMCPGLPCYLEGRSYFFFFPGSDDN